MSVDEVKKFVADRRAEDLTIDFKLAPMHFQGRDDRRTLAKTISGFANATGGLVVWGVDARPDKDGVDCAQALKSDVPGLRTHRSG